MPESIFGQLISQYDDPHPLLGKDSQAYPLIGYSLKQSLLDNAGAFGHLTMDDLIYIEARRTKQVVDAAYATNDADLVLKLMDALYPLLLEDIESGNLRAIEAYQPLVNQIGFLQRSLGSNSIGSSTQITESCSPLYATASSTENITITRTQASSTVRFVANLCWVVCGISYDIFLVAVLLKVGIADDILGYRVEISNNVSDFLSALFYVGCAALLVGVVLSAIEKKED